MTTRAEVVACARTWIGTPWHHCQIAKGLGVDCGGLLIGVCRELGLVSPDFNVPSYTPTPDGHSMLDRFNAHMLPVSKSDMQAGDVVVLITDLHPQHIAILANDVRGCGLSIIHAASKVIETRLVFARNRRFAAAFAFPGIEA